MCRKPQKGEKKKYIPAILDVIPQVICPVFLFKISLISEAGTLTFETPPSKIWNSNLHINNLDWDPLLWKIQTSFHNSKLNLFLVAEQLYKHRRLFVCLFICPKFLKVNITSTEARLAAGSCTVEWIKVLPTRRKWRPMPTPILPTQLRNSCSRIVLVLSNPLQTIIYNSLQ